MKFNLKKIRMNQVLILSIAVVAALYLIRTLKTPEDYEGETGPGPQGEETPQITEEDLKSVLKFIG
jgi:hypothetical protein